MNDIHSSDAAIIMLNYYPPEIVCRAIASIRSQTYRGTWTLYLGFHNRSPEHKEAVKRYCPDLPVHYVDLERDLVYDVRPRDMILQAALCAGNHRHLFFLDDDDEWYPEYLERMTSFNAPFITCAKDVYNEDTGEISTVRDDTDYEGMGFQFGLWRDRHLPYFIKQISDKHILRDFKRRYPDHPHIPEPLYRIHQHSDSVTFAKSLGRNPFQDRVLAAVNGVACAKDEGCMYADCADIAKALGKHVRDPEDFTGAGSTKGIVICTPSSVPRFRSNAEILIAVADQPPEKLFSRPDAKRLMGLLQEADALLLCDPLWVGAYETIHPHCLPIGIPSTKEESEIGEALSRARKPGRPVLYIPRENDLSGPYVKDVIDRVSNRFTITDRLEGSSVCWHPDIDRSGWGRPILEAFERGIPCITYSRTACARILLGSTGLLVHSLEPQEAALKIIHCTENDPSEAMKDSLMFFRRCFSAFYWRNYFATYLRRILDEKGYALE